jgi:outer membrane protein, heavy metal efflux system
LKIRFALAALFAFTLIAPGVLSQDAARITASQPTELSSAQYFDSSGYTVERLVQAGFNRRADLLAAQQRLIAAEGRLVQARLRPNPTLDAEVGSSRLLGGEAGTEISIGVSQVFETGGKRRRRIRLAGLELRRAHAEVLALERTFAAEIREAFARVSASGRRLDALERLIATNEELSRVTNARLQEGDVAPVDANVVRVETDRLRAEVVRARAEIESELITLRSLAGFYSNEPLLIVPLELRPPRLDLSLTDLIEIALRERADLQAARLNEEVGAARLAVAESLATPNVTGSIRYERERRDTESPVSLPIGDARETENRLVFGVSIDLPIFNRNQGEIASATGEREQALREREFLEAGIRRDTAIAYRRYRAAAESLVLYSTQIIPRAEANFRSVQAAYSLGEFSVFDVVTEQRRLIESQNGMNEALRDYYVALAELERAIGTAIPATGFAPATVSILPDQSLIAPARGDNSLPHASPQSSPQRTARNPN